MEGILTLHATKEGLPLSPKKRIIQLFKGNFNGALKIFMGRRLIWHLTQHGLIGADTCGSCPGKTATKEILNLQLIFDHCRMLLNDAVGC